MFQPVLFRVAGVALGVLGATACVGSLPAQDTARIDRWIAALADKNPDVREAAALALLKQGAKAKAAIPALQKALKDKEASVRTAVSQALLEIDGAVNYQDLVRRLTDKKLPAEQRRKACRELAGNNWDDEATETALEEMLSDADVKELAAAAVKYIRARRGVGPALMRTIAGGYRVVVFSPDGNTLATAGSESTVKLWDILTGKEVAPTTLTEARQRALVHCIKNLLGRLKKIPFDDGSAMAGWRKARQAVETAARATVAPLRKAEGRWLDVTVTAVLKEVGPIAAQQPEKVFARLERTRTTYADLLADHPDAAKVLSVGEALCLQAVVDLAVAEAWKQTNPAAASARLRETAVVCAEPLQKHEWPAKALQAARREVVNKALKKAGADTCNLIQGDRFQAAGALAEQLYNDFDTEAEAVGLAAALIHFRHECGYYADLARQAGRPDPP